MPRVIPARALRQEFRTILDDLLRPDDWVVVTKHGRPRAALVSMNMLDRLIDIMETEQQGPKDPATGRRPGRSLVTAHWNGPEMTLPKPDHQEPRTKADLPRYLGPVETASSPEMQKLLDLRDRLEALQTRMRD